MRPAGPFLVTSVVIIGLAALSANFRSPVAVRPGVSPLLLQTPASTDTRSHQAVPAESNLPAELPSGAHPSSQPLPLQHQNWVRVGDRLLSPSSWRAVGLALTCWTASGRWVKDARGVNASTGLPIMYRSHSLSLSYSVYKREAKQVLNPKACSSY